MFSLRPWDVGMLVQILGLLGRLLLLQHRRRLPDLIRSFDTSPSSPPMARDRLKRATRLTNALLSRLYGQRFCLQRSFILFHLYRKGGYPVSMHFGITRRQDRLTGHAWLDLNGTPFKDHQNAGQGFQTIYEYPSTSTHEQEK